jgi:hypothetical protein
MGFRDVFKGKSKEEIEKAKQKFIYYLPFMHNDNLGKNISDFLKSMPFEFFSKKEQKLLVRTWLDRVVSTYERPKYKTLYNILSNTPEVSNLQLRIDTPTSSLLFIFNYEDIDSFLSAEIDSEGRKTLELFRYSKDFYYIGIWDGPPLPFIDGWTGVNPSRNLP